LLEDAKAKLNLELAYKSQKSHRGKNIAAAQRALELAKQAVIDAPLLQACQTISKEAAKQSRKDSKSEQTTANKAAKKDAVVELHNPELVMVTHKANAIEQRNTSG
jgi:hypothetical protein